MENYSSDSPVSKREEDQFSRRQFSERVAQVIAKREDPSSIVVGIYGQWGYGKTTVLNFIEEALENEKQVICIKFNPWRYESEDELLVSFFNDICEALDKKLRTKRNEFKKLAKKAVPGISALGGVKGVGDVISAFISIPDLEALKNRVESVLCDARKRVLILIDDVDRLEKSEIHALFRLVKLTVDFKYTSYILAFDKDVVAASLQERYSGATKNSGEEFLEKIIQVPLQLPAIGKSILINYCFEGVEQALKASEINLTLGQQREFYTSFTSAFDSCLTTPRKAKLYGNILSFSLPIVRGEVNPVDFMLLEGIRVFYPSIYLMLKENIDRFVGQPKDEKDQGVTELIDAILGNESSIKKARIIKLIETLFPKVVAINGSSHLVSNNEKAWSLEQRVCSRDYCNRYFSYGVPRGDISDNVVNKLVTECIAWYQESKDEDGPMGDILDPETQEALLRKLSNKTEVLDFKSLFPIALALAKNSRKIQNPHTVFSFLSPFQSAALLVGEIAAKSGPDKKVESINQVIDKADAIEFKIDVFNWLNRGNDKSLSSGVFSASQIKEIGKHLGKQLENYLNRTEDVTKSLPRYIAKIFQIVSDYSSKENLNDYIKKISSLDPDVIFRILNAYTPISGSSEPGRVVRADLTMDIYKRLAETLDVLIFLEELKQNYPDILEAAKEFPSGYVGGEEDKVLLLKQFVWLYHKHVKIIDHEHN